MVRRQALPDELLLKVQKPARYLGNEINAVCKEDRDFRVKKSARSTIRFAMCFPDVYEIGMSHLGIQILYELFNRREDTWCERVFSPWTDMDRLLREEKIPLFALESQDPLRDFDFLGFTLQFELCYTNILQVLDLAGIPLDAADRTDQDPIVIGGGPCACNPEPVARFFDLFYIGEGETSYDALLDLYRSMKIRVPEGGLAEPAVAAGETPGPDSSSFSSEKKPEAEEAAAPVGSMYGWNREAFLTAAAQIPGIYVPSLYEVTYAEDGTIASFLPKRTENRPARLQAGTKAGPGTEKLCPEAAYAEASCEETACEETACEEAAYEETVCKEAAYAEAVCVEAVYEEAAYAEAACTEANGEYKDVRTDGAGARSRARTAFVRRQVAADLDDPAKAPYPLQPLIPFLTVTQDRVAVELQRGCIRGCRFCQAGMIYRPNRERNLSTVKKIADEMLRNTGQDDILLSSLSSSDYTCIREIVEHISERYEADRVKLQVPSLRIDSFSLDLMAKVQDVRRSSLTFAPEAGSQRLRDVINKGLSEENILDGAREAFRGGWNKVKLYFMLGLPTETEADRVAISDLANKISAAYYEEVPKEKRNGRCQITVSASFFVPKPFTPFQWARMYRPGDYLGFSATVNHAIYQARNHRSIQYSWHEADGSYLEGVLARGDRRVAGLILEAYRLGAVFDCWIETWDYARWEQAARNIGIDMDFYTVRERKKDEIFPWDFIDAGVRRDFLWKEWEKAHAVILTPNCREACSGCGAAEYGCGVCLRDPKKSVSPEAGSAGAARAECSGEECVSPEAGSAGAAGAECSGAECVSPEAGSAGAAGAEYGAIEGSAASSAENSEKKPGEDAAQTAVPARNTGASPAEGTLQTGETGLTEGPAPEELCYKVRMRLAKRGAMKFVGHLELMRFLQKCIRRTDIPVRYSDGVTPRMIMSTAMPLGLGLESSGEYIDMELSAPVSTEHALGQLRPLMPEGLDVLDFRQLGEPVPAGGGGEGKKKPQKAMSVVAAAEYMVRFRDKYLRSIGSGRERPCGPPEPGADIDMETAAYLNTGRERPCGPPEPGAAAETDVYPDTGREWPCGPPEPGADTETVGSCASSYGKTVIPGEMSGVLPPDWRQILLDFVAQGEIPWTKETKKGFRTLDMKTLIYDFRIEDDIPGHGDPEASPGIYMCVCSRVGENLRPGQLIGEAFRRKGYELPPDALRIFRLDLLAEKPDRKPDGEKAVPDGALKKQFISLGEMGHIVEEEGRQTES